MPLPFIDDVTALAGGETQKRLRRGLFLRLLEAFSGSLPYLAICIALYALMNSQMSVTFLAYLLVFSIFGYLLQYIFGFLADKCSFIDGYATTCNLRMILAEHLRGLPHGVVTQRSVGDITHVVAENVQMVEELLTHLFPVLVGQVCIPIFMAAVLFFVDWRLGLAALVTVPLAVLLMVRLRTCFKRFHRKRVGLLGEVSARLLEYVQGIAVIRSFNLAGDRCVVLEQSLRELRNTSIRLEVFGGMAFYSFAIVLEVGFVILLAFGGLLVLGGELTLSAFVVAMVVSQRFYLPLIEATSSLAMVSYLAEGLRRIQAIAALKPLAPGTMKFLPDSRNIVLENVSFAYADGPNTLSSVTCSIPENSLTAIVGPSGAGKSTLLHLLARFHDVQSGHIRIGGVDVRDFHSDTLMDSLTMVFQDVYLFSGTIEYNIRLGRPDASDADVQKAAEMANCVQFIDGLTKGYKTIIGEGGMTLSGGERQRLSIARALLKRSPIVLLDEATAAVDPLCERAIRTVIAQLCGSRTMVVVTHRLETIMRADQILVLDEGRLVETGQHAGLVRTNGCYGRLYKQLVQNLPKPNNPTKSQQHV